MRKLSRNHNLFEETIFGTNRIKKQHETMK